MSKKLAKLYKPCDKLDKYDNEPYMKNPLLKIHLSQIRERRHCEVLQRRAALEKIKVCRRPAVDLGDAIPIHESFYVEQLRQYVSKAPIPKMLKRMENKILTSVPKRLGEKYPRIVDKYMGEVQEHFDLIMKTFSTQRILKPKPGDFIPPRCDFRFKYLGKTENYEQFRQNREKLRKFLMIPQPFIRCIVHYSYTDFPLILNDFSKYRQRGELTLHDLRDSGKEDMLTNAAFITKVWYPKIVKIFAKHYKKRTLQYPLLWKRAFNCATGLIKRQLTDLKIRSLQHLNEVILDREQIPFIKLMTICEDNRLDLFPALQEIYNVYLDFQNTIMRIGDQLESLEIMIDHLKFKSTPPLLNVDLGDVLTLEATNKLHNSLVVAYSPIAEYLQNFQSEFEGLYESSVAEEMDTFLADPKTYQEYLKRIEDVKLFDEKLKRLVQKEYFDMGIVIQMDAIASLRQISVQFIQKVAVEISEIHRTESEQICLEFVQMKRKALTIPRSTEQLIQNGEYMLRVKQVIMDELRERIEETLKINGFMVDLVELPQPQIQIQVSTVNWYNSIPAVFELNATLFEQYKFQFEEKLQEVTRQLGEKIDALIPELALINDMHDTEKLRDYYQMLLNFLGQIETFDDYVTWINKEEVLFKFPKSQYPVLENVKSFVIPFIELMRLCIAWLRSYYVWMDGPFEYLEPHFVEQSTDDYYKEFLKTQKYYRNRIRQDLADNAVCKFRGQTEDPDPDKHPVPLKLVARMLQWIKDFRIGVQVVGIMCNPALCHRHWDEMSEIAGFDLTPDAGSSLRKILNWNLHEKLEQFEIISIGANKELQLQQNLAEMIKEWEKITFTLNSYKEMDFKILSSLDDVQAVLDDHIIKTLSMRGSAFVKPCEAEVKNWYAKLTRTNSTINQWGRVQSNWLYLLPIFSSKDIVAQMPEEGRLFKQVDQTFRRYMQIVVKEPLVMQTAPSPGLLEAMELANKQLEDIITGVNNYLEKKRLYFPRFFFLSNDEMLEILSETKDPLKVQPHLNKCFEGINRLVFNRQHDILAMTSVEKETVTFVSPVSTEAARGSVEKWLIEVETAMLTAVKNELSGSYLGYKKKERTDWVLDWPGMVILCISQIYWAAEIESCLRTRNLIHLTQYLDRLNHELHDIVALIRSKEITNLARSTIKALIVIDVHAKDVVEELVKMKVTSENDFQWLAQLRYYWAESGVDVRIISAAIKFACEYLGNSDRLVITPLTDRCYRTLMCAYQLHLNGAPEGPAGTGKTETTKDLAKALAVQCKVFNCSDGLDYKAMGKFFKGLASCGCWACFDEFNRIEIEVLSVVAQQILCIIQAVRASATKFLFEGTELSLNPTCYVCITMNPGYAGRSELPDNLKVLFRTVAMMVPDYALIGEISLYSYGFTDARSLAVKIVTTYRLCSEQLSSQNHYDYGMRAVKTVLSACGNLKKALPNENEEILLLRSLMDVNLPKFLSFDVPLFEGIISDLFPGVKWAQPDYSLLSDMFVEVCKEMRLQPKDYFLTKVIQTYEMMIVRHGFMLVGQPFSGKSSTLKVLATCLERLKSVEDSPYYQSVQYEIVNPKSITMGQLYGAFDPISYEWTDGIASTIFRKFATDTTKDRKWLIFDGPVDAVWIENMNTVLDDNKKLCLNSGEVITMSPEMSMIFEVMDLEQASPATVSRCGMIYMEPVSLGWEVFVVSWLNQCNPIWVEEWRDFILNIFKWVVPGCLKFVKKHCHQFMNSGEIRLVITTFQIFEMVINDACEENPEDYPKFLLSWFQAALLYSVVWGIGGILDAESRIKFDEYFKEYWRSNDELHPVPECLGKVEISIPFEGQFFDYCYIFKQKGAWKTWPDLVRQMKQEPGIDAIIQTIDTARYSYMLEMHVKYKKSILFVGPTGTGKSCYVQNSLMTKISEEKFSPAFITFTAQITANQTQDLVLSKLRKYRRGVYGSSDKKTCALFIDDINMPAKEVYGAQPPIELVRQYFDQKHWYDLKDTSKIHVNDILILAACGLVGGSKQDVYQRFLCHFSIFSINTFSEETMFKIFNTILMEGYRKTGHGADVSQPVTHMVNSSLEIYRFACAELLPTPTKSHYIFNLRDLLRVILGCAMLRKESVEHKKIFTRIWFHEISRVFYDRLINEEDRTHFYHKMELCVKEEFRDKMEVLFEDMATNGAVKQESVNDLIFGAYLDLDTEQEDRRYEEIASFDIFRDIALATMDEYNAMHKSKIDISLFKYALRHLNKICRILSMPGGSSLLVGISGSGRQSLTRLAAAIFGHTLFQPEITKNYGANDWREDIKKIMKESGGLGKETVFLFTENQIKMDLFLQDIDCLLNLGEVPNLFAVDEKQEILEMVRLAAQGGNRNLDVSPLQVFQYFVNRTKQKLHIILCFSPIGSSFRNKIRLYPSLVNCCTIDWYDSWPEDALEMVAEKYMQSIDVSEDIKVSAVKACKHFHVGAQQLSAEYFDQTGRVTYVTSKSYLELIMSFEKLINHKQREIKTNKMRYITGLERLESAAEAVAHMQTELNALQPTLIIMAENSKKMAEEIEKESIDARIATDQVKKDEIIANVQAAESEALKSECEKDLAGAIPILEEAIQALNTLKPTDITLVKSMKNPPEVIKLVMAAVCVMKSITPERVTDPATGKKTTDYWGPSKRLLGDMGFLQSLKDFDKDNINPDIMKKIRKDFIPHKDFQPPIVAKASSAAEGLCKWIIAMDAYDCVAKNVAPKKAKLAQAEREYAETMAILTEKRELAAVLEKRVAELNENLEIANAKKKKVEDEVEMCITKLNRAEKLLGSLGGEKTRWIAAAEGLQVVFDALPGDLLVSSGIVAYLAPFTSQYRSKCVVDWHNYCKEESISCSEDFNFVTLLGSDIKIQNWNIAGLPRDTFSAENGIILDISNRFSLFIDPQGQANQWIKTMEKNSHLQIVKISQSDYMKKIETAMEMGWPVLIENVGEDLEAPLDPLLLKNTFKQGDEEYISMGDNLIVFNPKFRLYLTSNLRNPHYIPEIFNKVTIINFALTMQGLEDQLLGIVVAKERPDLQELRQTLIMEAAKNKETLKTTEDRILKTLSETKGDILEDETAVQILDDSKALAVEIVTKQLASREIGERIENFRQSYRPVASHSANLYYCITDLPNIDPMYQFSLVWFINLYVYSIENASKSKDQERRLRYLMTKATENLYSNVCRSLFEKDKLLFSFILTTKIMMAADQIPMDHFVFLLKGGDLTKGQRTKPDAAWVTDKMWSEICCLDQLREFRGFVEDFEAHASSWKEFYDANEPHLAKMPANWHNKTTRFEKLIVLRALCPDKISAGIRRFVAQEMGPAYISPPAFDIAKSYEDSNCLMPLIFILSPGADPMLSLLLYAEKMGYDESFQSISLGQGQGPIAQKIIESAQKNGTWVCLQNCHLAASWMPTLENLWEQMDIANTLSTFRLWLTSYPSDRFPTSILQNGVKMTNEPPTGLQQNLLRSYNSEPMNDEQFYTGCPGTDKAFTKLLYGICFFHAVVQERRNFGPLGWNISYGFNESDFQISVQQIQMFLNQYDSIPYVAISYLIGECNYGGRVTDVWDRRAIITILDDYMNQDVVRDPGYKFSSIDVCYTVPRNTEHREIVRHIEDNIPNQPSPDVYGLHPNAGIIRDFYLSNALLDTLLLTHGTSKSGPGNELEGLANYVATIEQRLPSAFDVDDANEKFPVDYNESMNTVLVQEMQRFNVLLTEIRKTCQELQKGIKGIIVLTPELEEVCNALIFKKIPKRWMKKSYPSLKPVGSYIQDFLDRLEFLQTWFLNGKPSTFWIAGFFFTQAFLTGAMQNFARKYKIPIDTLTFDNEVLKLKESAEAPEDGVYIYGLFIEGASWSWATSTIQEQKPKVLIDSMPLIHLQPVSLKELDQKRRYVCPVYKTNERKGILSTTGHSTNYVLPILLRTEKPATHWIKRSVAMLCQTLD